MDPIQNWDAAGVHRHAHDEAKKRIERAAWLVENKAKELLSRDGTMTRAQVEHHATHTPGFRERFNRDVPFRRGAAGTTYVKLTAAGKLTDRKRSPNRKHP
jgi:hypothetical protein